MTSCTPISGAFGDRETKQIRIHIEQRKNLNERETFRLLPETVAKPANMPLIEITGLNMSTALRSGSALFQENGKEQKKETRRLGERNFTGPAAPVVGIVGKALGILLFIMILYPVRSFAQISVKPKHPNTLTTSGVNAITTENLAASKVWTTSVCAGCHGKSAKGGIGPSLIKLKGTKYSDLQTFTNLVRKGKGMMPAVPTSQESAADVRAIHSLLMGEVKSPKPIITKAAKQVAKESSGNQKLWKGSVCAGCHGKSAQGGIGPSLLKLKSTKYSDLQTFTSLVRKGKGMMPAVPTSQESAADVSAIHSLLMGEVKSPKPIITKAAKQVTKESSGNQKLWKGSVCAGCHGQSAQGGIGPSLLKLKSSKYSDLQTFTNLVRKGKGMMPAISLSQESAADVAAIHSYLLNSTNSPNQQSNPSANAVTTENVGANNVWTSSSCSGCHGQSAMGGIGPPLAQFKGALSKYRDLQTFTNLVRKGKGSMPAFSPAAESDANIAAIHSFLLNTTVNASQRPLSYQAMAWLSVKNVDLWFSIIGALSLLLALRALIYWIGRSDWKKLQPALSKFGYLRAVSIGCKSAFVNGFLGISLWRKDKFRWGMHGLLLYGFCGTALADILVQTFNPSRRVMPLENPIQILSNISGLMILAGIFYVRYRYKKDPYTDNGITLERDFFFIMMLEISILTGFLVEILRAHNDIESLFPVYLLHLIVVAVLFLFAPFTRFIQIALAPIMAAIASIEESVMGSGINLGFERTLPPDGSKKSVYIAEESLAYVDPDFDEKVRQKYYP